VFHLPGNSACRISKRPRECCGESHKLEFGDNDGSGTVNVLNRRHHSHKCNDNFTGVRESRPWLISEYQQKLFSQYPLFFRSVRYPKAYPSNLAFFGIQCGLGWYPLINAAAAEIERELYGMWCEQALAPEGMAAMDRELRADAATAREIYPAIPYCSGVAERSGKLQISMENGFLCLHQTWLRIRESTTQAEVRAQTACERCGAQGLFREFWMHVYCNCCIAHTPGENPFVVGGSE
jgi:ribosomal protein S14